ncbi:MAG: SDR family oxidoreductase [Kiloniellales bacterium]|nr:SDR family oxidoreductase [Kiloniellales bacterium]
MSAAVVIGGAGGIGIAAARAIARDGLPVTIADLDPEAGEAAAAQLLAEGHSAWFRQVDIRAAESIAALAEAAEERFGPVDKLVNSAGIITPVSTSRAQPTALHDDVHAVNYRGLYLACREFGWRMAASGGGAIVNIASTAGLRPIPAPAYVTSKYAVVGATEFFAAELGPRGVRVNAVAPTYTMTKPILDRIESGHRSRAAIRDQSALKILVTPEQVAACIRFLLSDEASAVTGVTLPVDAGWRVSLSYESLEAPLIDLDDAAQGTR